jgi:hypothetical protein
MSLNENNTDVSVDNIIEGPKKKKIEKKKDMKYPTQRNEVLKKVYEIIGVSQTKPYFRSHEIDFSDDIDQHIENLDTEIQQYFNVSSWTAYKSNNVVNKRSLSIVRSILKDMNVQFTSATEKLINNPNCKFTTIYTIQSEIN